MGIELSSYLSNLTSFNPGSRAFEEVKSSSMTRDFVLKVNLHLCEKFDSSIFVFRGLNTGCKTGHSLTYAGGLHTSLQSFIG